MAPASFRHASMASSKNVCPTSSASVLKKKTDVDRSSCQTVASTRDLADALKTFRSRGAQIVQASAGKASEYTWSAACDLVEQLLSGAHRHLPEVTMDATLQFNVSVTALNCNATVQVPICLEVSLSEGPLVGTFACRSRLGCEVHLAKEIRISLLQPLSNFDKEPLILATSGITFPPLPESGTIRNFIKAKLGDNYSKPAAYRWWMQHADEIAPLQTSMLRRRGETLLGMRSFQAAVDLDTKEDVLWGFMHGAPIDLSALEFYQGSEGVSVTAQTRPITDPGLDDVARECDKMCHKILRKNPKLLDKFAASATTWLRLLKGRAAGFNGADARKLTKLLTAATSWGPGKDGWQRWEPTWLCVDEKDWMSRPIAEQGRVVWRGPSDKSPSAIM